MLSILTPSYNYARFLPSAMESVQSQRTPEFDIEHVIMDGASTDGTEALLAMAADVLWASEPDDGQSDALNKALSRASGSVVGWLNADEFYLPGALSRVLALFDEDAEVDVVFGDVIFVDEAGCILRGLVGYPLSGLALRWRGCTISTATSFFRREALGADPWRTDHRFVMDWDLFLRLHTEGRRFFYLRYPVAAFRVHEAQVTAQAISRRSAEHLAIRERHGLPGRTRAGSRAVTATGDVAHRLLKSMHGSRTIESSIRSLAGTPLLIGDRVDPGAFERVLSSYQGRSRPPVSR